MHTLLHGVFCPAGLAEATPAKSVVAGQQELELLLADIERLVALGNKAPAGLSASVHSRAPTFAQELVPLLSRKIADPGLDEKRAQVYVIVLGETRDIRAIPNLIEFYQKTPHESAKHQCLVALLTLGPVEPGRTAIDFLLKALPPDAPNENAGDLKALLSDIDQFAEKGTAAPIWLAESVAKRVSKAGTNVTHELLGRLSRSGAREGALQIYIGLLGETHDTQAVGPLIDFASRTDSSILRYGCLESLAEIGGEESVMFVLPRVPAESNRERRFNLLNKLARTRSEALLPATLEMLESDQGKEYWRPALIFGKLGDVAVPFLVDRISATNRSIRMNAITILGLRMFAPEALQPLQQRFWHEEDQEIRHLIFTSITAIGGIRKSLEFLREVETKSKDRQWVTLARDGVKEFAQMKKEYAAVKLAKRPSREAFREEYQRCYDSAGKEGDMEALQRFSTITEESELKRLRERILDRNSDEALNDYMEISHLICINRIMEELD